MSMIIDMSDVEAVMEKYKEKNKPHLEKPDIEGVLARLQVRAVPELTYWRTGEANRRTHPALLLEALSLLMTSTIISEIMQHIKSKDDRIIIANDVLKNMAETMMVALTSVDLDAVSDRIESKDAGTA